MAKRKPTSDDAKMIMKLYDLRREPVMRKARNFMAGFFPQSADAILKLMMAWETEENAYLRQVISYWEMAATFVLQDVLHEELFLESAGEMIFIYAKIQPFLSEIRRGMGAPEFFQHVETLLNRTETGRAKVKATQERIRAITEMRKKASGA